MSSDAMPFAREYFPSDTLKLINKSEHLAVRGGVRGTGTDLGVEDKQLAHTIGRHLLSGSPGALGKGVPVDEFRDRFLGSPENRNSGWAGKGDMAVLLCEALNSEIGQLALKQLDRGIGRVSIHYLNLGKLAGLFGGLAGKVQLAESSYTVTPARDVVTLETIMNTKTNQPVLDKTGNPRTKTVTKTIPRSVAGKVTAANIASVNAVLDRFGDQLHLQTFFPSSEAAESYADWFIGMVKIVAAFDRSGKLLTKAMPAG
jgi:hypothetical protein